MAKSLLLALTGIAQAWYLGLEPRSMYSWEQLREKLHRQFQGCKNKEMTTTNLNNVRQRPGETIRSFQKRFFEVQCQVRGVTEQTICEAARRGITNEALVDKLERKRPSRVEQLYDLMESYARVEDARISKKEEEHGRSGARHREADKPEVRKPRSREVYHVAQEEREESTRVRSRDEDTSPGRDTRRHHATEWHPEHDRSAPHGQDRQGGR